MLKRNDIILISAIVTIALVMSALFYLLTDGSGGTVTVKQDNKTVYCGTLDTDRKIELSGNTVIIKDGTAYMHDADCKNQICVKHKKISKNGESIICLPNRVIIEISE